MAAWTLVLVLLSLNPAIPDRTVEIKPGLTKEQCATQARLDWWSNRYPG
jgi:hypothetical protein